ncbi:Growth hormone secretagogue receptor type 1 [Orchesella cincta]|uniref:Growth hormone secretagogue receptor type 1 n=1 Tax=Orchesella cincta TaxID=48709 RepID=A0A1D2N4L8_ORCCI|nr:Growth hormone secretagogue receptor type 1 [Orchesella cincta]
MHVRSQVKGKLVPFAELSVAHASVLTILAISLERYIAICRPLRANYTCTKQRAVIVCIGIWIIGCIATSPVLVIAQHKRLPYLDHSIHNACLTQAHNFWSAFYFLASITVFFFLPLFALVGLYWVISKNLMTDPSGTGRYCPDHPNMRSRRQVVMMLATVVFFFFICLLPFRIFTVYIILAPPSSVENMGQELYYSTLYFCRVMLYFNSAINPILYNVMSSKFREAFLKALGCTIGHSRRSRWLCRHLSRQSTFTTSSTLPTSSVKSSAGHSHHCTSFHGRACCSNGDSVRIRELSTDKNGHFAGRHPAAQRVASGPYYPSNHFGKKQRSSDINVMHTQLLSEQGPTVVIEKKTFVQKLNV